MQQVRTAHPLGTTILSRYLIEDILSQSGSAVVYLVRDQRVIGAQRKFINSQFLALKELLDEDEQERDQYIFEGELLRRLSHPALPRVYDILKDTQTARVYLLMEYRTGINLEEACHQQCFSPPYVITMMAPVFDALAYMHTRNPSVVHRAVRPSNIVISTIGKEISLSNFGIAREYNSQQLTTSAGDISAAYGAWEQFNGESTPRSDIYSLGATLYTLLTGSIPLDAPQRMHQIRQTGIDPLVPVQRYLPSLPDSVAGAIHHALSLDSLKRFSSITEFRQALNANLPSRPPFDVVQIPITPPSLPLPPIPIVERQTSNTIPRQKMRLTRRSLFYALLVLFCLVFFLTMGLLGLFINRGESTLGYSGTVTSRPHTVYTYVSLPHQASPTVSMYPFLVNSYAGTIHDILIGTTANIILTDIQQNDATIRGNFIGLKMNSSFTGVLDTSRHMLFTLAGQNGRAPLFFEGVVRKDGNIAGTYCSIDAGGQCTGDYGIWSIAPVQ